MTRSRARRYRYDRARPGMKRQANKHVRRMMKRLQTRLDYASYKRVFPSYEINDGGKSIPIPDTGEDWTNKARRK